MLYVLRHGKTDWNELHKLQGRTDIPLNEEGRKMAQIAAEKYSSTHFDISYCSPLIRAKETAEIILKWRDVPIITDNRLIEMSFGIYEGKAYSFNEPGCPVNVIFQEPENYTFPIEGAESWDELFERTGAFLEDVAYPLVNQGKDVLIVGHGAMNSCLITQAQHKPLKEFWNAGIENCKLFRLL